jgi:lysophospholipase L1-like esterase
VKVRAAHGSRKRILAIARVICFAAVPAAAAPGYDPSADVAAATRFFEELAARPTPEADGRAALPRVALFGDSTALAMNVGLQYWLDRTREAEPILGAGEFGCGLLREGRYRFQGRVLDRPDHCSDRAASWRKAVRRDRPDVALVSFGTWEVCDRQLDGDPRWRHVGDPVLDERLRAEMRSVVDLLAAEGVHVVWLTHPRIEVRDPATEQPPAEPYPESDPGRMERFNELVRELPAARPGKVEVLDLAGHLRTLPGGELDRRYRPDGVHLSAEGTLRLAHEWLRAQALRIAREQRAVRAGSAEAAGDGAKAPR